MRTHPFPSPRLRRAAEARVWFGRRGAVILAGLVLGSGLLGAAMAADLPVAPGSPPAVLPPPAPPLPRSPVAVFRILLSQSTAEREATLSRRNPAQRALIVARLAEYETLAPEVREERLMATDLFWHLQQLLPRAPAERGELIAVAPESLRAVLSERLAVWDAVPAGDRAVLLQHERAIRYFSQVREVSAPPLPGASGETRPARVRLSVDLPRMGELPAADRLRLVDTWRRFFDPQTAAGLTRRQRALQAMSEAERREMAAVLTRFQALPVEQRRVCLESFARFAALSPAERRGFLRNAERWESLAPEERRAWRDVVNKLPPVPPLAATIQFPPLPGAKGRGG